MEVSESGKHFDANWSSERFCEINTRFGDLWFKNGKSAHVDNIGNLWFNGKISENDAIKYLESEESK